MLVLTLISVQQGCFWCKMDSTSHFMVRRLILAKCAVLSYFIRCLKRCFFGKKLCFQTWTYGTLRSISRKILQEPILPKASSWQMSSKNEQLRAGNIQITPESFRFHELTQPDFGGVPPCEVILPENLSQVTLRK